MRKKKTGPLTLTREQLGTVGGGDLAEYALLTALLTIIWLPAAAPPPRR